MTEKNATRAPLQADRPTYAYSPEILPQMQSLLAALADMDCAFEVDLETVRASRAPEIIKRNVIATLEQRHQERRAPLIRQIEALQRRIRTAA